MRRTSNLNASCCIILLLTACGPGSAVGSEQSTTTSSSSETGDGTGESSAETTTETETETETETGGCEAGITDPFEGEADCDAFFPYCPEGEKCVPVYWLNDAGEDYWCVPVMGTSAPGEPCTPFGPIDQYDDCDATSVCAGYDEDKLGGVCHPFCTGSLEAPECIDGWGCWIPEIDSETCLRFPIHCVELCDPLAAACEPSSVCAWLDSVFTCVEAGAGAEAEQPCMSQNDCGSGLMCAPADTLSNCAGEACCTPYCSLAAGDEPCAQLDPEYGCEPFFVEPPSGYEDLGVCLLQP
jgi:hypothetical protein